MAKIARQAHQSKYPTWSARDNYAKRKKKKKAPNKLKDGGGRNRLGCFFVNPVLWCRHIFFFKEKIVKKKCFCPKKREVLLSKNIWHSFFLQKKNILWQKFLTDKSLQEQLSFEQNVQPLVLTNHVYFVIKWVTGWEGLWEVTPAYFVTKFSLMLCLFWKTNEFWDHLLLSLQLGAGIIGRLEFINFQEQYFAPQNYYNLRKNGLAGYWSVHWAFKIAQLQPDRLN